MPTNYPGNIDNYSVKIDGVDTVAASHVNDLQDAVTAVETELGTNPKGSYPSLGAAVAARAEKVSGAVSGNLAGLDSGGNLTDSGKAPADFLEDITGCNFTELADAPHSYTGFGGKVLKVNTGETAIEFSDSVSADEKVKADVGDATAGYLSEKTDGVTVEVDLTNHVLQIKDNGVNADKLAHDIDATGIGFDADKVDGLDAEDFVQTDQLQTLSATTPLELSNSPQLKASAAPVISIQAAKVTEWDGAASHRAAEDAVSGIIKGDGAGGYSAAAADTDYAPASKGATNGKGTKCVSPDNVKVLINKKSDIIKCRFFNLVNKDYCMITRKVACFIGVPLTGSTGSMTLKLKSLFRSVLFSTLTIIRS